MEEELIIYYHFRNEKNAPVITYCLITRGEFGVGRGVSICSEKTPIKKDGRKRAKERAKEAFISKEPFAERVNRNEAKNVFKTLNKDYIEKYENEDPCDKEPSIRYNLKYFGSIVKEFTEYKSFYNPSLTQFEEKLLKIRNPK